MDQRLVLFSRALDDLGEDYGVSGLGTRFHEYIREEIGEEELLQAIHSHPIRKEGVMNYLLRKNAGEEFPDAYANLERAISYGLGADKGSIDAFLGRSDELASGSTRIQMDGRDVTVPGFALRTSIDSLAVIIEGCLLYDEEYSLDPETEEGERTLHTIEYVLGYARTLLSQFREIDLIQNPDFT